MNAVGATLKFTDPCWTKAGNDLAAFLRSSRSRRF